MGLSTTAILVTVILTAGGLGAAAYLVTTESPCKDGLDPTLGFAAGGNDICVRNASTCPKEDAKPFAARAGDGVVRFEFRNEDGPIEARMCLIDADGVKRYDRVVAVPAEQTRHVDVPARVAAYTAFVRIEPAGAKGASTESGFDLDLGDCRHRSVVLQVIARSASAHEISTTSTAAKCIARPAADPDAEDPLVPMALQPRLPPLDPGLTERLGGAALVFAVLVSGLAGLVHLVRTEPVRWAWLGLFSRVTRPRALDQDVRAQVHALVESDPGVRGEEVRHRLGLAAGQTAHHLRILVQTGLVERLRVGGIQHHFVSGRYGTAEKRRHAILRGTAARTLYETIRHAGEGDLSSIAQASGFSVAYASRLAARLQEAGLVDRVRDGRRLVLRPKQE